MNILLPITATLIIISFFTNKNKTFKALKIAYNRLIKISIPFLFVIIFVSITLYLLPTNIITTYLSQDNQFFAVIIAALIGSITMMPGFIAFPLSGILKGNGVPFMVISAFTTTLMMVGILTFPVEKKFFGTKVAVTRNLVSFFIAITIAIITGILFGEISL